LRIPESRAALLEARRDIARRIDRALAEHPEVSAVLVFGSVASGDVDERSDVDVLVVCRACVPPLRDRRRLLGAVGTDWVFRDRRDANRLFADRDTDGLVDGVPVTVHYQTAPWIASVLGQVLVDGAVTTHALPFGPYTLPGLLQRAWLLSDKERAVAGWREQSTLFPEILRANILGRFLPVLQAHSEELLACAERQLGPRVFLFHLDRAVDALFGVLWAVNGVYDPADKRAEQTYLPRLARAPADLLPRLTHVLLGPFDAEHAAVERVCSSDSATRSPGWQSPGSVTVRCPADEAGLADLYAVSGEGQRWVPSAAATGAQASARRAASEHKKDRLMQRGRYPSC
jgi:predicted nucleotidyltransferase